MKLLLSARDPGAVGHMKTIAGEASRRPDLAVKVVAASPACEMLKEEGVPVERFRAACVADRHAFGVNELLQEANEVLACFRPDALLVGLSHTMEAGVDEALLACAADIPTYVMQDFWGDVNHVLERTARTYFVIDEEAARLTRERHRVSAQVVGSPKHRAYANLQPLVLRRQMRTILGAGDEQLIVGFFGQPLQRFAGYLNTIHEFAQALRRCLPDAVALYRPHPRETPNMIARSLEIFKRSGLPVHVGRQNGIESWIAVCDVVCSCFSTCCYDALFLNRYSLSPLGTVVYLMFDPQIRKYGADNCGFVVPPPVQNGAAFQVCDRQQLEAVLLQAAAPESREHVWQRIQNYLPDVAASTDKILTAIQTDVAVHQSRHDFVPNGDIKKTHLYSLPKSCYIPALTAPASQRETGGIGKDA